MAGRGRALDNIFVERLWRTIQYEEVYLNDYKTVSEARAGLGRFIRFYNHERLHQALDYRTPSELYPKSEERATYKLSQAESIHLKQPLFLS